MKQDDQSDQQPRRSATNPLRIWLVGGVITLLLVALAALPVAQHLIASAAFKQKIQETVAEQTGGRIEYQAIDLSYWPQLTIELSEVSLNIPDRLQGTIAALRVSPEVLPLLIGKLHLARLELETPELRLQLPDKKPTLPPASPDALPALEKNLATALEPLGQVVPDLDLRISNSRLSVIRSTQTLVETDGLTLQLDLSVNDPRTVRAALQGKFSKLTIHRNGHQETIKNATLNGSVQMARGEITAALDRLTLVEPALELTGNLNLAPTAPGITLNLSGSDINVDATRRTALALAGDISPTKQIFDYLRGGQVPQISFTARGEKPAALGDLNNILIKGQLQNGKISIPELKLDLTEVNGDVVIREGVLQGSRLSARLNGSTGRDGSLKIGLPEDNDLFQLELTVNADLQQSQAILQRVVDNPTFVAELEKVTNLQGIGRGRLSLGDRLDDITAKIKVNELKLSADYQRVPFPVSISQGQFAFSEEQVVLGKLSGTLGKSQFADLSCQILWEKDLHLDITFGRFGLVMEELYPWLASLEGMRDQLADVKQVTGRINLSTLNLKGLVDTPAEWQYASTGTVQDLSVDTELFPDTIKLTKGDFKVDAQQLTFQNLQAAGLDAELILAGSLKDISQQLEQVELTLDGRMGPDSVEWLRSWLEVPAPYAIRAPLRVTNGRGVWQPAPAASFKGKVSIEAGPVITADVDYRPDHVQIHQLTIKDQHSDADIILDLNKGQRDFKFTGTLQHETLEALFVNRQFGKGQFEGEFAVTIPQTGQSGAVAEGQLTGANLSVPLPSGDKVTIDQVTLNAVGSQVKVEITKSTWKDLTLEPVVATVSFDPDRTNIRVTEAKLCGVKAPGVISIAGEEFSLDLSLEGKGLDVTTSYSCLTNGAVKMTGALDFSSQIRTQGQAEELVSNLQGPLEMKFTKGVIEQDKMLASILEVLNVTEIVKGRLPNLDSRGFAYTTMDLHGKFQNGKFIVEKLHMDGETLDIIGHGELDLEQETVNLELLTAPFKTVDSVVKHIPGINYLLAGSLVAIPVSVTGNLAAPRVQVMSAASVGSALLGLGERIIESPIKLIESIIPGSKDADK